MKKIKKNRKYTKHPILIIIIIIVFYSLILTNYFGKKITKNAIKITNTIIDNVVTKTINNNIKTNLLKKYSINSLIEIKKNKNKIESISYDLEKTYSLMNELKNEINKNIKNNDNQIIKTTKNFVVIQIPFYNYKNNALLTAISPKINIKLQLVTEISGNIKPKIQNYGINSSLIELYIIFNLKSTIITPFSNNIINNNYKILIGSTIVQGEIPYFYNFDNK